jgi:hypothetical protein
MPKNIFGQKMPNQPRATDRTLLNTPVTPSVNEDTQRQTETMVSVLRSRRAKQSVPKKASFFGV